ncbi:MAG: hypothetical protein J0H25_19490, partial [Rhizobiales bacterium]|nr:hypothetical protein [Hyphomicrobiales bacterium]
RMRHPEVLAVFGEPRRVAGGHPSRRHAAHVAPQDDGNAFLVMISGGRFSRTAAKCFKPKIVVA